MEILEPTGLELYKAIFSMKTTSGALAPPATRILSLQGLLVAQDLDQQEQQTFGQTNRTPKILQVVILIDYEILWNRVFGRSIYHGVSYSSAVQYTNLIV